MGLTNLNLPENVFHFNPDLLKAGGKGFIGDTEVIEPPNYSTSIADAWSVVEKVQANLFSMDWETGWTLNAWNVYFKTHEEASSIRAVAPTAPLAICRAVLKAKVTG
jgi:hypothetical protein